MSADTAGPTCKASAEVVSPLECSHDWVAADASEDVLCVKCGLRKRTRAEVVSQPPQEGWQPIESAPRDGSRFVGGWYHKVYGWCWDSCRWQDANADKHPSAGYFYANGGGDPTHWMPLPTPPASAEGSIPSHIKP